MHDIKWIRDNPEAFDAAMKRRGLEPLSAELLALDAQKRQYQTDLQELQTERNQKSKLIGAAKAKGEDAEPIMKEVADIKERMAEIESKIKNDSKRLSDNISELPNIMVDEVPDGDDEAANVQVRIWGEPKTLDFEAKDHVALGEALGQMDFETAAKMSGSRFVLLSGGIARLERALAQFMLDLHTQEHGYTECSPPLIVRYHALFGTGQLPKFEEDLYECGSLHREMGVTMDWMEENTRMLSKLSDYYIGNAKFIEKLKKMIVSGVLSPSALNAFPEVPDIPEGLIDNKALEKHMEVVEKGLELTEEDIYQQFLIPTAEVALTNIVADEIVAEEYLPRRYVAYTPCFRSEAGAAGKDTRGMIRQHQFSKVELVSVTTPDKSMEEHERMTASAEEVLKRLELPYRVMLLCSGDTGFGAKKTYDLEVWLPGQNAYREISSCSVCGDFQARRMKARYRPIGQEKGAEFVHTLNGSGVAVGRALIAVLENYQQADGSIVVPEALRPYMGNIDRIEANG